MIIQNEFPKAFSSSPSGGLLPIETNTLVIHIDHERRLRVDLFNKGPHEIGFLTYCVNNNEERINDKLSIINIHLRCSNHVDLKLSLHDKYSGKDINAPIPQKTSTKIYSLIKEQSSLLETKQIIIQLDSERTVLIEVFPDNEEVKLLAYCYNDKKEISQEKFAALNLKPGACNTLFLNIDTHKVL